jgi:hypothetical protein
MELELAGCVIRDATQARSALAQESFAASKGFELEANSLAEA